MDPQAVTHEELILGITLIFAVATACQIVAPRLKVPALVLLLPAGFLLGIWVPGANPLAIFGDSFGVIVDLVVAVILFQGGMELGTQPLREVGPRPAMRMVWLGGLITWGAASTLIALIIGVPLGLALLTGAIVTVSGPTVVNPLLEYVKPEEKLRTTLMWEGTVLDPLGALLAVAVFQAIKAGGHESLGADILSFFAGLAIALIFAVIGAGVMLLGARLMGRDGTLGTQMLLGSVILASGLANLFTDNAGLLTALAMGLMVPRLAKRTGRDIDPAMPFFGTVVTIAIGVLFVGISALVSPESLVPLIWPTLAVIAILILVVRPAMVFITTAPFDYTWRERLFMGWMAPRGIVAAGSAASMATTLIALKVPGAEDLLPVAFMIIVGTVFVYGLSASPVARLLGVRAVDSPGAEDDQSVDPPPPVHEPGLEPA